MRNTWKTHHEQILDQQGPDTEWYMWGEGNGGNQEHGFEPREQGKNLEVVNGQTKGTGTLFHHPRGDQDHTAKTLTREDYRPQHTDTLRHIDDKRWDQSAACQDEDYDNYKFCWIMWNTSRIHSWATLESNKKKRCKGRTRIWDKRKRQKNFKWPVVRQTGKECCMKIVRRPKQPSCRDAL